jgi:hypothetical protein
MFSALGSPLVRLLKRLPNAGVTATRAMAAEAIGKQGDWFIVAGERSAENILTRAENII